MILTHDSIKEIINEIKESGSIGYTIFDNRHMIYWEQTRLFQYCIEILDVINHAVMINEIYKKLKIEKGIDILFLYPLITCNLTGDSLSENQLEKIIIVSKQINEFENIMYQFNEFGVVSIPYKSYYIAIGLSCDERDKLNDQDRNTLDEEFGLIYSHAIVNEISISDFIKQAKELIAKYKNIAKKEKEAA